VFFEKYTNCTLQELLRLAEDGDEKARNAWCAKRASDTSISEAEKEGYHTQASNRGCPIGQFNLAVIMQNRGSIEISKPLIEKSAAAGYEEALFCMAVSALDAEFGFAKDETMAYRLLVRAASNGLAAAQV
jgi:TPR repeat protein